MAKLKFNNKLQVQQAQKNRRDTMLDEIKRVKETGDPSLYGHDYRDFIEYLQQFYGKSGDGREAGMYAEDHDGGFEDFEMDEALEEYLTNPTKYNTAEDFEGDSVDREFIREILLNKRNASHKIDPLQLNMLPKKKGKK
jgi:hypothetical protein